MKHLKEKHGDRQPVTNGKKYDEIIGATGGKETQYVRIENSANTIHGHPISESEYLKLLK